MPLTAFCVADRPISLRIIRALNLANYSGNVGIMVHANTSANFQDLVAEYPLEKGICPFHHKRHAGEQCARVQDLRRRTIRICDSGAFTKNGVPHTYDELFQIYQRSGVEFGIIIDHLRRAEATIESATRAMDLYKRLPNPTFKLVGVAQGRNAQEYVRCYAKLRALGYQHIAIGGLLNRRQNTARYVYVQGGRLFHILEALREKYPRDWMFALGCYHPRRHTDLERFNIFGSDYKGWIFNYKERNDLGITKARRSRVAQVRRFLQTHVYADKRQPLPFRGRILPKKTLAVIACSKSKVWDHGTHQGGALAKDTYTGTFFKLASNLAARDADAWVVLSARHGFLLPNSRVPGPYNAKLKARTTYSATERLRSQAIQKGLLNYRNVVVFGGTHYVSTVKQTFAPFGQEVTTPFKEGTRIGTRLGLLKRASSISQLGVPTA